MGTVGWRREPIRADQIAGSKLATAVVGTDWTWAGIKSLYFRKTGKVKTPWGEGTWGLTTGKVKGVPACDPPTECLYVDFSSALHHVAFDLPRGTFRSIRVGDGEKVDGVRIVG